MGCRFFDRRGLLAELEDVFQLGLNGSRQLKRIQLLLESFQFGHPLWIRGGRITNPLKRGLRPFIDASNAGADTDLARQLDRGQEQVLEEAQLVAIEVIHGLQRWPRVIAPIAQQPPHMRPVLLLNVSIVIFFVRPAARELDGTRLAIAVEMCIDEF